MGKVGGERSRRRKRAFTVGIRNSHPPANSLTARRGPLRLRGGPGGGGSAAPAPAPRPGAALTCPMEVPRRPPAPAPPARASPPGDLLVQAGSPPPATPPGLPAPEVFHLTSAFAASQMLKIPRHLSPGAYQGPEEGGGRRAPRPEISLREPGRGRAAGRGGARGGGASRGDPGSGGPAASPRLRTRAPREPPAPPVPAARRGRLLPGPGPPSLRALRPARRLPRLESQAERRGAPRPPPGPSRPCPLPLVGPPPPAPGGRGRAPPAGGGPAGSGGRARGLRGLLRLTEPAPRPSFIRSPAGSGHADGAPTSAPPGGSKFKRPPTPHHPPASPS